MEKEKNIYQKIADAKSEIKATKMKKEGKNKFSNYDYFTPSQIEQLVFDACTNNGILTKFDLVRSELGIEGVLRLIDVNSDKVIQYRMASAIPEIKATNISQQLGGCLTYTERYLKMSAFGIVDNSLDFDDKDNLKPVDERAWLNPGSDKWSEAVKWLNTGGKMETIETKYKLSKVNRELLISEAI